MKPAIRLFILSSLFLLSATLHAKPIRGFHEGPYILLSGGVKHLDWDKNERTQTKEGNDYEPLFGLSFGWNVLDWIAPELMLQYSSDANGGRREHIAQAHFGPAFFPLIPKLLDKKKWRILPYIKPSFSIEIASLPGDTTATDNRITMIGVGGSIGGGLRAVYKYFYGGIGFQETFLVFDGQTQLLTNGSSALIYSGGLKTQFETFVSLGVHY